MPEDRRITPTSDDRLAPGDRVRFRGAIGTVDRIEDDGNGSLPLHFVLLPGQPVALPCARGEIEKVPSFAKGTRVRLTAEAIDRMREDAMGAFVGLADRLRGQTGTVDVVEPSTLWVQFPGERRTLPFSLEAFELVPSIALDAPLTPENRAMVDRLRPAIADALEIFGVTALDVQAFKVGELVRMISRAGSAAPPAWQVERFAGLTGRILGIDGQVAGVQFRDADGSVAGVVEVAFSALAKVDPGPGDLSEGTLIEFPRPPVAVVTSSRRPPTRTPIDPGSPELPVSAIRLEEGVALKPGPRVAGDFDVVEVWNRGKMAGELRVRKGDGQVIVDRLRGGSSR